MNIKGYDQWKTRSDLDDRARDEYDHAPPDEWQEDAPEEEETPEAPEDKPKENYNQFLERFAMRSESLNELAAALAIAQGAMENAKLNKTNPHFKNRYADLASIRDASRVPLSANGIAVMQQIEMRPTMLVLITTLHHASGQWISSEYPLPAAGRPQEMGSALTYARRYALSALLGIAADEDDDGNGAERAKQQLLAGYDTPVDAAQLEWLRTVIDKVGADVPKFLSFLSIKTKKPITRLEDLPASIYPQAIAELERKKPKVPE